MLSGPIIEIQKKSNVTVLASDKLIFFMLKLKKKKLKIDSRAMEDP